MGPDLVWHQQPVTVNLRKKALLLLACAAFAVGVAAALFMGGHVGDEAQSDTTSIEDARGAVVKRALTGDAHASNKRCFINDLNQGIEEALLKTSDGSVSYTVTWHERRGLQAVSSDLLETYRKLDEYAVVSSGYLDIKGNVWGALLAQGKSAVDVVMVTCDEEDSECTARVARLVPTGKDGTGDG